MRPTFVSHGGRRLAIASVLIALTICAITWALVQRADRADARSSVPVSDRPSLKAGDISPDDDITLCYVVLGGDDPNAPVSLDTQILPSDDVLVRRSSLYCQQARHYDPLHSIPPAPAIVRSAQQCFATEDGQDAGRHVVVNGLFGVYRGYVGSSLMMCENAMKHVRGRLPYGNPGSDLVRQCYKLASEDGTRLDRQVVLEDGSVQAVTVGSPRMYCPPAIKRRDGWDPFGSYARFVSVCFEVEAPQEKSIADLVTNNFGRDTVLIIGPTMICDHHSDWWPDFTYGWG